MTPGVTESDERTHFRAEEIWTFGSVLVCSLCPTQDPYGGPELARTCEAEGLTKQPGDVKTGNGGVQTLGTPSQGVLTHILIHISQYIKNI